MKIRKIDEDSREVTFNDGVKIEVARGWTHVGGWGWQARGAHMMTVKSLKAAAQIGRLKIQIQKEQEAEKNA